MKKRKKLEQSVPRENITKGQWQQMLKAIKSFQGQWVPMSWGPSKIKMNAMYIKYIYHQKRICKHAILSVNIKVKEIN